MVISRCECNQSSTMYKNWHTCECDNIKYSCYSYDANCVQGQIRLNGDVNVTQLDIPATNGYIHQIDGLLTPASLLPLLPHRCDVISQRTVRVSSICVQMKNSLTAHVVSQLSQFVYLSVRGAGAMAPKPPWLTQNFAQWRQDRTWFTQVFRSHWMKWLLSVFKWKHCSKRFHGD